MFTRFQLLSSPERTQAITQKALLGKDVKVTVWSSDKRISSNGSVFPLPKDAKDPKEMLPYFPSALMAHCYLVNLEYKESAAFIRKEFYDIMAKHGKSPMYACSTKYSPGTLYPIFAESNSKVLQSIAELHSNGSDIVKHKESLAFLLHTKAKSPGIGEVRSIFAPYETGTIDWSSIPVKRTTSPEDSADSAQARSAQAGSQAGSQQGSQGLSASNLDLNASKPPVPRMTIDSINEEDIAPLVKAYKDGKNLSRLEKIVLLSNWRKFCKEPLQPYTTTEELYSILKENKIKSYLIFLCPYEELTALHIVFTGEFNDDVKEITPRLNDLYAYKKGLRDEI